MKKIFTSLLVCASLVLWTTNSRAVVDLFDSYFLSFPEYTFGMHAKCSDVAGIGEVLDGEAPIDVPRYSPEQTGHYIVRVIHPFMGCVSNQEIRVRVENRTPVEEPSLNLLQTNPDEYYEELASWKHYMAYYPTNQSCIVFAVETNRYNRWSAEAVNWNVLPSGVPLRGTTFPPPLVPSPEIPIFKMFDVSYAWWHDTSENQPITTHFSNAVVFVRTERNWTNYYELCRSGLTNSNFRIMATSQVDMDNLIYSANDAQLQYMLNDPFHPVEFKTPRIEYLIESPMWRFPPNRRRPGFPDVPLNW